MNASEIADLRLRNQQIAQTTFKKPAEIISWMGALQSQDYAQAKWAIGLRLPMVSENEVEKAINDGTILRTHILRPTWHFVTPADIRWMLELTAPRVNAITILRHHRLELSAALLKKSNRLLAKSLLGGKHLTRSELAIILGKARIETDPLRLAHIMMHAELAGILCSGANRGKQFTYALLDERAPMTKKIKRDEALAKLTERYFMSRGPATLHDFGWWSGLTVADARAGIAMVKSKFIRELSGKKEYWLPASAPSPQAGTKKVFLLPNYDEYVVGYTDRNAIFDSKHISKIDQRGNAVFNNTIVINGKIEGTWQRIMKKDSVLIDVNLFSPVSKSTNSLLKKAAISYAEFLNTELMIS